MGAVAGPGPPAEARGCGQTLSLRRHCLPRGPWKSKAQGLGDVGSAGRRPASAAQSIRWATLGWSLTLSEPRLLSVENGRITANQVPPEDSMSSSTGNNSQLTSTTHALAAVLFTRTCSERISTKTSKEGEGLARCEGGPVPRPSGPSGPDAPLLPREGG